MASPSLIPAGDFRTSYAADTTIFPTTTSRNAAIVGILLICFAPQLLTEYWLSILIQIGIFAIAALGGEVPVPTLEGKASLRIPVGTQTGQVFKLRGKGIANIEGRGRGDLLARVIVEVPTRLNSEQRRKLEEFANSCGEENTPLHRSFFERAKDFFR